MLFMFLFSLGPTIHYSSMVDWDEWLDDSDREESLYGDAVFQEEEPQYDCLDLSGVYTCSDRPTQIPSFRNVEIRRTGTSSGYTFSILPSETELKNSEPNLMFGNFVADGGIKLRPHSFRPDIQYAAQCNEENLVTVMHNNKRGNGVVLKYGWSVPEEQLDIHINFFQYLSPESISRDIGQYASTSGDTVISCQLINKLTPEYMTEATEKLFSRGKELMRYKAQRYPSELKSIICSLIVDHGVPIVDILPLIPVSRGYIQALKCHANYP